MHETAPLPRRDFLRLAATTLLTAPFAAHAATTRDDFTFVVASDLHYRDPRCGTWLHRVVTDIRALRPRPAFCALAGDLSEDGSRAQLGAVREIFAALPMPLHAIIGNHDYEGRSRAIFEQTFGTRLNRRFDCGDCTFIELDTTAGCGVFWTKISDATLSWLDRALRDIPRTRPLIVITHFPLGCNWLQPVNAASVLARLRGHSLRAVMSGHWHGFSAQRAAAVELSTARCCSCWRENHDGSEDKGYTLCRVRDGEVTRDFVPVR